MKRRPKTNSVNSVWAVKKPMYRWYYCFRGATLQQIAKYSTDLHWQVFSRDIGVPASLPLSPTSPPWSGRHGSDCFLGISMLMQSATSLHCCCCCLSLAHVGLPTYLPRLPGRPLASEAERLMTARAGWITRARFLSSFVVQSLTAASAAASPPPRLCLH